MWAIVSTCFNYPNWYSTWSIRSMIHMTEFFHWDPFSTLSDAFLPLLYAVASLHQTICFMVASGRIACKRPSDEQIQYMPLHRNLQRWWQQKVRVHIQQIHSQCKSISISNSSSLFDCWPPIHHIKSLQRKQPDSVEVAPALGAAATDQAKYDFDPVAL